jgi:membrane associated rhomboid family serine protease
MIIPWATDAPIYHRPWATIAMMVVSIAAFFLTSGMDPDVVESYMLTHGAGLHPVQWITSNFLHANFLHLAGNLVFLWAFALVVEGKVGFFPFLVIFLGVGFLQCGLEQLISLALGEGVSLGNSAIVYGLMAIALVWAPKNELSCFWWFGFRSGLLDMSILWFSVFYIALEVFEVAFWGGLLGMKAGSAVLHLSGAVVGFGLGTAMLKLGWVDCENWDLYSVMGGREGKAEEKTRARGKAKARRAESRTTTRSSAEAISPASLDDRSAAATRRLQAHLQAGSVAEAYAWYDKSSRTVAGWMPPEAEWLALIQALLGAQDWPGGVTVMEDYLRKSPKPSARVRLRLAQILVKEQQRPAHALKVLEKIPEGALPENLALAAQQLQRQAEQMREAGVLELEGDAW